MTENALTQRKDTRIAPWGDRSEIREMARRVKLMAPGAQSLSDNEALALAQGAVAHGLDPFNGEIWYIPKSGLMAGVKGLRKAARQQIDGNYWMEFHEITDPDERKRLRIPENALAYKGILRDSETILAYSEAWKQLAGNSVPIEIIPSLIGDRPFTEGIGYFTDGEKTKMSPVQVAMKRAETDALKRRFDLPFAVPSEPTDTIIIEGEWSEMEEEKDLKERAAEGNATLFGAEEEEIEKKETTPTIEALKGIALNEPYNTGPTQYWQVANHFGIDKEQGQAIYAELGNWADALIHIVEKFGELENESTAN